MLDNPAPYIWSHRNFDVSHAPCQIESHPLCMADIMTLVQISTLVKQQKKKKSVVIFEYEVGC